MTAEEFIKKNQNGVLLNDYTLTDTIWFMEKYADEILKIAAVKAKTKKKEIPYEGVRAGGSYYIDIVDKDTILNCLK